MKKRLGPDGVHLFDRHTGWNYLFDAAIPPEADWHPGPRQVSIALTDRCDLQCQHCYAPKTRNRLLAQDVKRWMREFDDAGALGIGFGGGEPTLHPDFADLCDFAAKQTRLAVTFTTHGLLLDDSYMARLHGHVHFYRISVDGIGPVYEQMRGRPFHRVQEVLSRARRLAPFGVNTVVNERNIHQLEEIARLAESSGACELLLLPQQSTAAVVATSDATVARAAEWAHNYRGKLRLAVSEAAAAPFAVALPLSLETGLKAYAHIDAAGCLRENSFTTHAVRIGGAGVMSALAQLQAVGEGH